ncbi:hypothetical protein EYF80_023201 [Liparis tanakae]|uniref:Uncharacterized protein n=1 Tax=Liparis tanakae TaxID=230148 RepID=A0A4Z2HMK4_9TELE|nr:hypothetical protein EYF80_023201 [Liparis tanakae]
MAALWLLLRPLLSLGLVAGIRTRALVLVLVWSVHVVNEAVIHVSSTPDSQGRLYFIRKLGRTRKLETHRLRQHIGGRMILMLIRRLLMRRPRPIRERRWPLLLGVVVCSKLLESDLLESDLRLSLNLSQSESCHCSSSSHRSRYEMGPFGAVGNGECCTGLQTKAPGLGLASYCLKGLSSLAPPPSRCLLPPWPCNLLDLPASWIVEIWIVVHSDIIFQQDDPTPQQHITEVGVEEGEGAGEGVLVPEWRSCVSWWETPDMTLLQRGVLGNVDRSIWRGGNHR